MPATLPPGSLPSADMLVDLPRLVAAYYVEAPDPEEPDQRVAFGTSGHRGSSLRKTFNEPHILAITQAVCEFRGGHGPSGPLYLGMDTHALSVPACASALEVLAANEVEVMIAGADGYTPTPAVSHAILTHNRGRGDRLADGIVITPSHNPPEDGGFKYNPPTGGPADVGVTRWIEARANALLANHLAGVRRVSFERARHAATTHRHDYLGAYTADIGHVIDMEAIAAAGVRIGADPLGGAGVLYWPAIAQRYRLELTLVNDAVDPTFRFVRLDHDGRIRMDPSSPYVMRQLIELKDRFDVAVACDTDHDRHGIVTPGAGLLSPNAYLVVAMDYLFRNRPRWRTDATVGKTMVSSSLIDRVAGVLGRALHEVPVGFKWFVPGLLDGSVAFAGEESAGATFARIDGTVWTTDKDGIVAALLAAEITARTGRDPGKAYAALTARLGTPAASRLDIPATPAQKARLKRLSPGDVHIATLAGEQIQAILTRAPANAEPLDGIKVVTENAWFAVRPSGTEHLCKIYAETFSGADHLARVEAEARALVQRVIAGVD